MATARKDNIIQIRTSAETKVLLNRAAAVRGQKLSEFMLDSARRQAEDALLDQRAFFLGEDAYEQFLSLLDNPGELDEAARSRLKRPAPWKSR